jgi:hypothetical protein
MANTFELIASSTVGAGGAASIDFTSIPSTYTDLCLKASIRDSKTGSIAENLEFRLNGSSTNFSGRYLMGTGAAAASGTWGGPAIAVYPAASATASTFGNLEWYIPNYASSNYKSFSSDSVAENNATTGYDWLDAMLWSNTAAITSISFIAKTSFVQYSTAYLYGVKNA